MQLLFVIDCLGSGGAQRQMVNLACGLKGRGHDVTMFVYYPSHTHFRDRLLNAGVELVAVQKKRRFSLMPALCLRRLMKGRPWDGILSFLDTPNVYSILAHVGATRAPIVVSERFMDIAEGPPRWRWCLMELYRFADHITVNSHHQRERMERAFPWMSDRLTTIYNGVDLSEFVPSPVPRNGQSISLLAVGTVVPKKNPIGLIRGLAEYNRQASVRCSVRWAGKVTPDAQSQRTFAEADRLIDELGVRSQWTWLGERHDIPALLRDSDGLIHPAFYEGLPNAICEALACGRPVLASNVCDHPRLVQDGECGFLFDPHDARAIARAIERFGELAHSGRKQMGEAARAVAEAWLSLSAYVCQYEQLFKTLRDCRRATEIARGQ